MEHSETAQRIWALAERTFQRPDASGARSRTFHRPFHAMMRCRLSVDAGLAAEVAHGLFARPRRYEGWVRFSSANFQSERIPDSKGLALKLLAVPGETCLPDTPGEQDFLMCNQPVLFFGTEALFLEYGQKVSASIGSSSAARMKDMVPAGFLIPGGNPLKTRWNVVRVVATQVLQTLAYRDPARYAYYTGTAFRLGKGAMKLGFRPVPARGLRLSGSFADRLKQRLAAGPIGFDFLVQPRTVPEQEPIDDATVRWRSPWVKVGSLEIPQQDFDTGAMRDLAERISYSPWNCLKAHEPLGGLNAARRLAYGRSAENRGAMCPFGAGGPRDGNGDKPVRPGSTGR